MTLEDSPGNIPPPPVTDDEDEDKKRGRSSAGAAQFAQLSANIRPDVVSAPGGLQVVTTQQSADHRPDIIRAKRAEEIDADAALDQWLNDLSARDVSAGRDPVEAPGVALAQAAATPIEQAAPELDADAALDQWFADLRADVPAPAEPAPGFDEMLPEPMQEQREALFNDIAAHQHAAFTLPAGDESFLHFVKAVVTAESIRDPRLPPDPASPGAQAESQESHGPGGDAATAPTYWYLSFATVAPNIPGNLGTAVIAVSPADNVRDIADVAAIARDLGCNPGGECVGAPFSSELTPPNQFVGRLLTSAEAMELASVLDRQALDFDEAKGHVEYVAYTRDFAAQGDEGAAAWLERKGYEPAPANDAERFRYVNPDTGTPWRAGLPLSPREAVETYANHRHYLLSEGDGRFDPDFWRAGTDRIQMIADDGDYIMSGNTYRELAAQLVEEGDLVRDDGATERYNAESARRQDTERRAGAGEDIDPNADITAYFDELSREARDDVRSGNNGDYENEAGREPGDDRTPPGGGGRGF
jgi:hypothetical protein